MASRRSLSFEAIGTAWQITLVGELSDASYQLLCATIQQRITSYDQIYSRFRSDSLVTTMSQKLGTYKLPADAETLIDLYQKLYDITDGRMTPLIGQLLVDAGYDSDYSLQPGELHAVPAWPEAIDYDFPNLTIKQPVLLDFGAAGKGYLVDIIADICKQAGVQSFSINAGGDIVNYNVPTDFVCIGLEHPTEPEQIIGIAKLKTGSLCGSAGNRRAWQGFHHIMDPATLKSSNDIRAIWVVADSGLLADGLATALFFAEARQLAAHFAFEYALIRQDFSLEHSNAFPAQFFSEQRAAA